MTFSTKINEIVKGGVIPEYLLTYDFLYQPAGDNIIIGTGWYKIRLVNDIHDTDQDEVERIITVERIKPNK